MFDQREHVAHAQDSACHAVWVELLEGVHLFAGCRKCNWFANYFFHRQRRATARIAIKFRQDHCADRQRFVKCFRNRHCVLPRHCIYNEERVVGLHRGRDVADLLHHFGVDSQAARGVHNQHVAANAFCFCQASGRGCDRVARCGKHGNIDLRAKHFQLLYCSGALQVGANQHWVATLRFKPCGQLCRTGGFTRALQTCHQHHRWRLRCVCNLQCFATKHRHQFGVNNFDDLLARVERLGNLRSNCLHPNALDNVAHHANVDVGFQQCRANLGQHFIDIVLGEAALCA